ncbi:hypothetical protein ABIB40_002601 [Pedobacter sp. UYP30]|uniref:endo-1,3-alpha-glucanase family glycosylhydrolase n=1 Tax=Pedobacter sp. UYP30 TaxID=1756400 RepID=UPI003392EEFF
MKLNFKKSICSRALAFAVLLFLMAGISACKTAKKTDDLKNLPALTLPISKEKLVIAHCMTNIIRYKNHPFEDSCNPEYYFKTGNITAPLGGLSQVYVMADSLLSNASLEEAVAFEIKAAKKCGIDGFQFYYHLGSRTDDDIIKAYFKVADEQKIDFKFTFCISHPKGKTESIKIADFAERINGIFKAVGQNNKHWLRTPDGRLLVYSWYGEDLADIPAKSNFPKPYYAAKAFQKLANAVHDKFACVYTINQRYSKTDLNNILDYFPAVWIWTLPYTNTYSGFEVAKACKERNRNFTASVFNDFYTSKLLKKGTWDMYHNAADAVKAGIDSVDRKYIPTGLSNNFRNLFDFGIKQNAQIINVITWNDYPEGHHIAPEINHNYGFAILLNYYKSLWKGEKSSYQNKDVAIAFFKKYQSNVTPNPYNIPVVSFEKEAKPTPVEDSIEVVTLLKDSATLYINNQRVKVAAGLKSSVVASKPGNVIVRATRSGKEIINFITPEGITTASYRTDRLTYSFSSEFKSFHHYLFGDDKAFVSSEYSTLPLQPQFKKPTPPTSH